MPSLIPQLVLSSVGDSRTTAPLDLDKVFCASENQATVSRVIKYISNFYFNYSQRTDDEISRPNIITEEFCLTMPTRSAHFDEMAVAEAILAHSSGAMPDGEIKAVLDDYLASHIFEYLNGVRTVKRGNFDIWADCSLVYINSGDFGFTCNYFQAYLLKLLHQELVFEVVKL